MEKPKRSKNSDTSSNGCIADGCLYWNVDGCVDFDGGCIDLPGDGCFGGFDGCNAFDGCSMGCVSFPLRIIVILGLMLYGDYPVPPPNNTAK